MIRCEKLTAGYEGQKIIEQINFEALDGELTVILGPNGCGKSTLLRALLGILPPLSGGVYFGEDSSRDLSRTERARRVAFLTQSRDTPDILAGRLVLHGRFPWLGFPRRYGKQDYDIAKKAMEQTGCLEYRDIELGKLSGGQRQKVYLAMTIAQDTETILLDEPTTFLDIRNQMQLLEMARTLANDGKAVVMVLHDLSRALRYADRILVLQEGRQVAWDTPKNLYASGILEEVFQVKITEIATEQGTRYLCDL